MRSVSTPEKAETSLSADVNEESDRSSGEVESKFVRNLDGTITSWDSSAQDLYGWDNKQALGKVSHALLRTVFPEELDTINRRLIREGRWVGKLVHTRHDGEVFEVSSHWDLKHDDSGLPIAILETNVPLGRAFARTLKLRSGLLAGSIYWAPLIAMTLIPLYLTAGFWRQMWHAVKIGSWDGTGHYVTANIYSETIFPDTFGWMPAFFSGMPFPNFYPALFYWCVALLHSSGLSFPTAFKIMIALPTLLIPFVLWMLARRISQYDSAVAAAAGLAVIPLLVHWRFQVPFGGLDYFNTFQVGLYTQPLGFIFFVFWYLAYLEAHRDRWRFALAALLLGLATLASFFAAITAGLFMLAAAASELTMYFMSPPEERAKRGKEFTLRITSAAIGLILILFWIVPMLSAYEVFASHPVSWFAVPSGMWSWYLVALLGVIVWLPKQNHLMRSFLLGALILGVLIVVGGQISPRWFPIQPFRLLAIFNFLLAVPVGYAVVTVLNFAISLLSRVRVIPESIRGSADFPKYRRLAGPLLLTSSAIVAVLLSPLFMAPPKYDLAFLSPGTEETRLLERVLSFAEANSDGRYLVQPILYKPGALNVREAFTSKALIQYLGASPGGSLNGLFSEASPHRLYFGPQATAFSLQPKNPSAMGSALGGNDDFFSQPISLHLQRLNSLGVRYLLIHAPEIKAKLSEAAGITKREEFGEWSVYRIDAEPARIARPLDYRPGLVVSTFSFKERYAAQYDFVRLTEEQFADGWFDVLLTLSPETRIDRLQHLDRFGALILDKYEYDDQEKAFALLREFAQRRALILLESDSPLFERLKRSLNDFPMARIIFRSVAQVPHKTRLEDFSSDPSSLAIRKNWQEIRSILDAQKIPVSRGLALEVEAELDQEILRVVPERSVQSQAVPVLLNVSFHPNWRRSDGAEIYPATPFLMVTFVNESVTLVFSRHWYERLAVVISAVTLVGLVGFVAWPYRNRLRSLKGRFNRLP